MGYTPPHPGNNNHNTYNKMQPMPITGYYTAMQYTQGSAYNQNKNAETYYNNVINNEIFHNENYFKGISSQESARDEKPIEPTGRERNPSGEGKQVLIELDDEEEVPRDSKPVEHKTNTDNQLKPVVASANPNDVSGNIDDLDRAEAELASLIISTKKSFDMKSFVIIKNQDKLSRTTQDVLKGFYYIILKYKNDLKVLSTIKTWAVLRDKLNDIDFLAIRENIFELEFMLNFSEGEIQFVKKKIEAYLEEDLGDGMEGIYSGKIVLFLDQYTELLIKLLQNYNFISTNGNSGLGNSNLSGQQFDANNNFHSFGG